jgi:hypothetical protein
MSTQRILSELEHLSVAELREIKQRAVDLEAQKAGKTGKSWREALMEVAGTAVGLPEDFAINHDHYIHGTEKRVP